MLTAFVASRRGTVLLAIGALVGAALAARAVVRGAAVQAPSVPDAVATVNGVPIGRAEYDRALAGVAAERRAPPDAALRRRVLDRLIDEELLVQRGLALGLAERDPRVRADLAAAVIALAVEGAGAGAGPESTDGRDDDPETSEAALRRWYAEHAHELGRPPRIAVEEAWFGGAGAAVRAAAARRSIDGGASFATVRAAADRPIAPLPAGPLPLGKLEELIGRPAAARVQSLVPGQVSEPLAAAGGVRLLRVVAHADGEPRPFEQVRDQVRAEVTRRAGDRRLRQLLDDERRRAEIRIEAP